MTKALYPWQEKQWQRLTQKAQNNKLAHAMLFVGSAGIGKQAFAEILAGFVLCQEPQGDKACAKCKSCLLFNAGNHPDFRQIEPEGKVNTIRVDSIRELNQWVSHTPHTANKKVIIIQQAHCMNIAASNSLLKTLEEPISHTIFILVSALPMQLLATVRSRCQLVKFHGVTQKQGVAWLQPQVDKNLDAAFILHLAHYAPLKALQMADKTHLNQRTTFIADILKLLKQQQEPVAMAAHWHKQDMQWMLQCVASLLSDLMKLSLQADDKHIYNRDMIDALKTLAQSLLPLNILALQDAVQDAYYQATLQRINLNNQLQLEAIFIALFYKNQTVSSL